MSNDDDCIEDYVTETDKRIASSMDVPPECYVFQRIYNPLHFYCRLVDYCGIDEDTAFKLAKQYEHNTYDVVMRLMRSKYNVKQKQT